MTVVAIDTLAVTRRLMAAGFTDQQAEAVTMLVREAQDVDLSSLATKAELQAGLAATQAELQAGLAAAKADLATTKAELQQSLAETKADILKWMVSAIGIQTVVILGAVLALFRMAAH